MDAVDELAQVHTKSSLLRKKPVEYQTVVYESKKKTVKPVVQEKTSGAKRNEKTRVSEIDMKQNRYEVMKFAFSGLDRTKREEAEAEFAIKLGAMPPKKKYVNYKELKEMKQQEALKKQEEEMEDELKYSHLVKLKLKRNPKLKKRIMVSAMKERRRKTVNII